MADERAANDSAGHSHGTRHDGGGCAFIANRYDGQPGNYAGGRAARSADVIVCLLETVVYMDLCVMGWLLHLWSISC